MLEEIIHGIEQTVTAFGDWGYVIIFFAAFLESSAFMGLVVPGESIVVISGFLAYQGYLNVLHCLWVISLGAVLGDTVGYLLGRLIGREYFERHKRLLFLKLKHIKRTETYFKRHGGKTIFFGRFVGLLRAMAPFAAGMSRMSYARFFPYNLAGGVLWALAFTLLGYYFGKSWQLIEKWSGRVGLFLLFMALILAGFVFLYRFLSRRRQEIYSWISEKTFTASNSRRVERFKERHPLLVRFIRDRLSPKGYLGLHLAAGLFLSGVFVWVLGGIVQDLLTGVPLVNVDRWVEGHVLYFRAPVVTELMLLFARLGSPLTVIIGSLAVIASLLSSRRLDFLIGYMASIIGGTILVGVLKTAIHRARAETEGSLWMVGGWTFPSSHTMISVVFYGMIAYLFVQSAYSWKIRAFSITMSLFIVFLIGFSRIYLQVHYLSDVLVGWAGGLSWLFFCITGLEIYRFRKTAKEENQTAKD